LENTALPKVSERYYSASKGHSRARTIATFGVNDMSVVDLADLEDSLAEVTQPIRPKPSNKPQKSQANSKTVNSRTVFPTA
jgi:hypothetical protein